MSVALRIQTERGGYPVGSHDFDSRSNRVVKIGSLRSLQLPLDDPKANRLHALIELGAQGAVLRDLGSLAGTYVNGTRTTEHVLAHGDAITIGSTVMQVSLRTEATRPHLVAVPAAASAPVVVAPAPSPWDADVPHRAPLATVVPDRRALIYRSLETLPETALDELELMLDFLRHRHGTVLPAATTPSVVEPPRPLDVAPEELELAEPTLPPTPVEVLTSRRESREIVAPVREKYDTLRLVATMHRDERWRRRGALAIAAALVVGIFGVVLVGAHRRATKLAEAQAQAEAQKRAREALPRDDAAAIYRTLVRPESLAGLATRLWGDPTRAPWLLENNRAVAKDVTSPLAAGTRLRLPRAVAYTVQRGDSLGVIAAKELGEMKLADAIFAANRAVLEDPSRIEVGSVLELPLIRAEQEARLAMP